MKHPFIVGDKYFDRNGEYTVLSIDADTITIQYDTGHRSRVGISIKARVYQNLILEQRALHPYASAGYFQCLGYLAVHADFQAEVPPQSRPNFEEKYFLYAGHRPQLHSAGYYPIDIVTTYDKWGPELRIYFPQPTWELEFPPNVSVTDQPSQGLSRINNNGFWWQMVRVGFRLGRGHNVPNIRASVPPSQVSDFDLGLIR